MDGVEWQTDFRSDCLTKELKNPFSYSTAQAIWHSLKGYPIPLLSFRIVACLIADERHHAVYQALLSVLYVEYLLFQGAFSVNRYTKTG